jgi:D-serine deaminase-like pyridoxal phosphate-dependent protein
MHVNVRWLHDTHSASLGCEIPSVTHNPNDNLVGAGPFRDRLNTPALGVDLDAFEANIAVMARLAKERGIAVRPHAKAHKSPHVARIQMENGAVGLCCATVGEAEVLSEAGLPDLMVTAPVSTRPKQERLTAILARTARVTLVVDDPTTVQALAALAQRTGREVTLLIDLDVGQRRTGVTTPAQALRLAEQIRGARGLRLAGVQGYAGHLQAIPDLDERNRKTADVHQQVAAFKAALEQNGHPCPVVSGGGTGTSFSDLEAGVFTEIQPGSYIFMDAQYSQVPIAAAQPRPYRTALRFFTRIISAPHAGFATTDGGTKSMAADGPPPVVVAGAPEGTVYSYSGDEFGRLTFADPSFRARVGDLIEVHVPHCDTSVALHDAFICFRGDTIEKIWPIAGRGRW